MEFKLQKTMKLLRAFELLETSLWLLLILRLSSPNCIAAEIFENINDSIMDNGNASTVHKVAYGYDNGTHLTRAKRFIAFPIGSSFSVSETFQFHKIYVYTVV